MPVTTTMRKTDAILKFGEDVEGYALPVLNEREVRAAAGLMFLVLFVSLMLVLFKGDFLLVKYVVIVFLTDFSIRVFLSPKFSPLLIIGRLIVSSQVPEYVGAPQKNFAWTIGLALSALMFLLLVVLNSYSVITGSICFICLVFLFFESAFGICLGCLFYGIFYKQKALYCAGEICEAPQKQAIQKTSLLQLSVVVGFIVYVFLAAVFFNDHFRAAPRSLREMIRSLPATGASAAPDPITIKKQRPSKN